MVESARTVLEVRDLDVWYGRVQVLFGLDLEVGRGEAVAMLGTNGAGKTTLLSDPQRPGRLPRPARSSSTAMTWSASSAEDRARRGLVQVRGADVFPGLTVDENLRAALVAHPALRREAASADRPGLRRVPGAGRAPAAGRGVAVGRRAADGGAGVRVAVRAAAAAGRRVVAGSRAAGGAAPDRRAARPLRAAGQAMVVVEQSLTVAAMLADRVVFVEKGAVRFDGPIGELTARDEFARADLPRWPARDHRARLGHQPADAAERRRAGAGVRRARRRHRARVPRQRRHQLRGGRLRDDRGGVHGGAARRRDRRVARAVLGSRSCWPPWRRRAWVRSSTGR